MTTNFSWICIYASFRELKNTRHWEGWMQKILFVMNLPSSLQAPNSATDKTKRFAPEYSMKWRHASCTSAQRSQNRGMPGWLLFMGLVPIHLSVYVGSFTFSSIKRQSNSNPRIIQPFHCQVASPTENVLSAYQFKEHHSQEPISTTMQFCSWTLISSGHSNVCSIWDKLCNWARIVVVRIAISGSLSTSRKRSSDSSHLECYGVSKLASRVILLSVLHIICC